MKYVVLIAGLVFLIPPARSSAGNFFKDYLKDRYPVQIVSSLPQGSGSRIIMVSTRNFKKKVDFGIKRGLDPNYRLTYYAAALRNDTAFLVPLKSFSDITMYLPPEKDFLVLVDGHGKTFGQSMERGFEVSGRFNINMIVFDWPTDYLALRKTVNNSSDATVSFVRAMRNLNVLKQELFPDASVSVIFHSMGNRIIKEIGSTNLLGKMPDKLFSNIIINAAAVKQQNHSKWVENLDIQRRIYITMNERDFSLKGAAIIRISRQLGLSNNNKTARNAYYVNFNQLATINHNLFLGRSELEKTNPEVQNFYELAFHGREVALGDHTGFQILSPSDKSFLFSVR